MHIINVGWRKFSGALKVRTEVMDANSCIVLGEVSWQWVAMQESQVRNLRVLLISNTADFRACLSLERDLSQCSEIYYLLLTNLLANNIPYFFLYLLRFVQFFF